MRKWILVAALALALAMLAACAGAPGEADDNKIKIVTTIFPEYDWTISILGENPAGAEVTMLLDKGVDLHNFQPTAEDIMKVATCDLFIYTGGESDAWVEDALKESVNPDMKVINLMETLGGNVKEEEIVEGMECEEEEEEGEEEAEYDEHVWLSLKNASILCRAIEEAIASIDPANAAVYEENLKNYQDSLHSLDVSYQEAVDASALKTLLFGDRFPFRYLTDDYGLTYYAAFVGCSAETEASFETITFLTGKVDELSLPAVLTIEGSDKKIAETIVSNTKEKSAKILTLDSMQATTAKDVENGKNYLNIMEQNLAVLKEAL